MSNEVESKEAELSEAFEAFLFSKRRAFAAKTLRTDEKEFFMAFLKTIFRQPALVHLEEAGEVKEWAAEQKQPPLRIGVRKKYIIKVAEKDGKLFSATFLREGRKLYFTDEHGNKLRELDEKGDFTQFKERPPRYTPAEKERHSKAQATSFISEALTTQPLFGHQRKRKGKGKEEPPVLIGLAFPFDDQPTCESAVLPHGVWGLYDEGTVSRHEFDSYEEAEKFRKKKYEQPGATRFVSHKKLEKALAKHPGRHHNEIHARLRWTKDCVGLIPHNNLPCRLAEAHFISLLKKYGAKVTGHAIDKPKIYFYTKDVETHKEYTEDDWKKDCAKANEIVDKTCSEGAASVDKAFQTHNFKFLLLGAKSESVQEILEGSSSEPVNKGATRLLDLYMSGDVFYAYALADHAGIDLGEKIAAFDWSETVTLHSTALRDLAVNHADQYSKLPLNIVNKRNKQGRTALTMCALYGKADEVMALLEHPELKKEIAAIGDALQFSIDGGNAALAGKLLEQLFAMGYDQNLRFLGLIPVLSPKDQKLLLLIIREAQMGIAQTLIRQGISKALEVAVKNGCEEIVQEILCKPHQAGGASFQALAQLNEVNQDKFQLLISREAIVAYEAGVDFETLAALEDTAKIRMLISDQAIVAYKAGVKFEALAALEHVEKIQELISNQAIVAYKAGVDFEALAVLKDVDKIRMLISYEAIKAYSAGIKFEALATLEIRAFIPGVSIAAYWAGASSERLDALRREDETKFRVLTSFDTIEVYWAGVSFEELDTLYRKDNAKFEALISLEAEIAVKYGKGVEFKKLAALESADKMQALVSPKAMGAYDAGASFQRLEILYDEDKDRFQALTSDGAIAAYKAGASFERLEILYDEDRDRFQALTSDGAIATYKVDVSFETLEILYDKDKDRCRALLSDGALICEGRNRLDRLGALYDRDKDRFHALISGEAIATAKKAGASCLALENIYDQDKAKFQALISNGAIAIYKAGDSVSVDKLKTVYDQDKAKFHALISDEAIATYKAGASFWALETVYDQDKAKFHALISDEAIATYKAGASFWELETVYGRDKVKFQALISGKALVAYKAGASYWDLRASYSRDNAQFQALISDRVLATYKAGASYQALSTLYDEDQTKFRVLTSPLALRAYQAGTRFQTLADLDVNSIREILFKDTSLEEQAEFKKNLGFLGRLVLHLRFYRLSYAMWAVILTAAPLIIRFFAPSTAVVVKAIQFVALNALSMKLAAVSAVTAAGVVVGAIVTVGLVVIIAVNLYQALKRCCGPKQAQALGAPLLPEKLVVPHNQSFRVGQGGEYLPSFQQASDDEKDDEKLDDLRGRNRQGPF